MSSTSIRSTSPTGLAISFLLANAALQFLDTASTLLALQAGGFEANPISRHVMEHWGTFAWATVKGALALSFVAFIPILRRMPERDLRSASAALGLFCFGMTCVVVNNLWIFTSAPA